MQILAPAPTRGLRGIHMFVQVRHDHSSLTLGLGAVGIAVNGSGSIGDPTLTDHITIKLGEPSAQGGIVHATFEGSKTKGTIELTPTKGDCVVNPVTQVRGVGEFTLK